MILFLTLLINIVVYINSTSTSSPTYHTCVETADCNGNSLCRGRYCCNESITAKCSNCNSLGKCYQCANKFYLDENDNQCYKKIPLGQTCAANNNCWTGKCKTNCCKSYAYDNCLNCDTNGECDSCETGYSIVKGGCINDSPTTSAPITAAPSFDSVAGSDCSLNSECDTGAKCLGNKCCETSVTTKCNTCNNQGKCTNCKNGFYLSTWDNKCYKRSNAGETCNVNQPNVNKCWSTKCAGGRCCQGWAAPNCATCNSNGVCIACKPNYRLGGEKCFQSHTVSPTTNSPTTTSCSIDSDCTGAKICRGGNCCLSGTTARCDTCSLIGECTTCKGNKFYLNPDNTKQCLDKVVAGGTCSNNNNCWSGKCKTNCCKSWAYQGCSYCNTNGVCTSCTGDYTLVNGKCQTKTPSRSPTTKSPSSTPTSNPSSNPSSTPSKSPSSNPSSNPSSTPSKLPSSNPSSNPSSTPSKSPSSNPSSNPSSTPSKSPSSNPSTAPQTALKQLLEVCSSNNGRRRLSNIRTLYSSKEDGRFLLDVGNCIGGLLCASKGCGDDAISISISNIACDNASIDLCPSNILGVKYCNNIIGGPLCFNSLL